MLTIDQSPEIGVRAVDASRGTQNSTVNAQWATRPDDQKFLSLEALAAHVEHNRAVRHAHVLNTRDLKIIADKADSEKLLFARHGGTLELNPTNWAFGQACTMAGAPAGYLRKLPAFLSGVNLQYGLATNREDVRAYYDMEKSELLALTSPEYGRIHDSSIVQAVQHMTARQPQWKVPGVMDWKTSTYNPYVDVTKDTTTLFASDRDVFMFLVDDTHPIEIGKLSNGEPDYIFRGFYAWNSAVGAKTAGIASFFLRGVCQNRNLWGVENFTEIKIRHTKYAANRWLREAIPALAQYANASPSRLLEGINNTKSAIVATDGKEGMKFLTETAGLTKPVAAKVLETCLREECHEATSVWDMCQGITATARAVVHQDARLDLEAVAGRLMKRAAGKV